MTKSQSHALAGFILGWGSPLGALALEYSLSHHLDITHWVSREIHFHTALYIYITLSTVLVFTLFGYILGREASGLQRLAVMLESSSETLSLLSMTDSLTGLFNHRTIQERLELEMERSNRYQTPLSILMIDIDDFKKINDVHGHVFGDYALKQVTVILQDSVRKLDIIGRYGGEEFLVILPQTSEETAREVAERIRTAIADAILKKEDQSIGMTVTIGLASAPRPDLANRTALLKAADKALYKGKFNGKNRVEVNRGISMTPERNC